MSISEIQAVEAAAHKVASVRLGSHAAERMAEKGIKPSMVEACVRYGRAIEIHNEAWELRVVLRHEQNRVATCVVLGLKSGTVVTVWKNRANDNHRTLDLSVYQWKADVASILKGKYDSRNSAR